MKRLYAVGMLIITALFLAAPARAALILTPIGIADGFTLTTFASGLPHDTFFGPFGLAITSSGTVIVSDVFNNTRYVFADVDGQTPASALNTVASSSSSQGYATAGGQAYGGDGLGHYVQFNSNGTINHILSGVTQGPYLGMWGNSANGHIIATSLSGLIDIDPLANGGLGSSRVINTQTGDGVTVSPDGATAYLAQGSAVNGYSIATGALVFSSGNLFSQPDGTGVISSGNNLNGQIIVNTNFGDIDLLDPVTHTFVVIATGGSRGDYVAPDTTNGTLLLDYTDFVARLSCGSGCSIGGPPSVPETSTFGLLGLGLVAGFVARRRLVPKRVPDSSSV